MNNNQKEKDNPLSIEERTNKITNKVYPPSNELLYHEYCHYYTWNKNNKKWKRRIVPQKSTMIGRIYTAHPGQGERFYLRILVIQHLKKHVMHVIY